jgi:hypothetical protein
MAKNHPVDYVKLVASLMPKQIEASVTENRIPVSLEGTF